MKQAIFFETGCGCLHRCMFAGLDKDGHAQWVMINQGNEVLTLREYMMMYGMKREEIRLLCLEGELVKSSTLALLLGSLLHSYPTNIAKLSDALKRIKNMGIVWCHDVLKLKVHVCKYFDKEKHADCHRFIITCGEMGCIAKLTAFDTINELMNSLRCFFEALELETGVALEKTLKVYDRTVLEKMDSKDLKMFDII